MNKVFTIPSPQWVDKYLLRAIFLIAVLLFVAITIYASFQIPFGPSYTEATRATFIFKGLASLFGLVAAYWFARNRWLALLLTVAIELFISGLFFELVSLVEKAY